MCVCDEVGVRCVRKRKHVATSDSPSYSPAGDQILMPSAQHKKGNRYQQ